MTHSSKLTRAFGRPPYSWQTRIMRGYIPALIDLAAVCPTEGVKTGAMDLQLRTLASSSCRRTRADPRAARNVAFSSTAEISRSIAALLSFSFPFLPFFLSFFRTPDLSSVIGPRRASVLLLFVRSFEFALPRSRLAALLTSCSHASLNPFPPFSLSHAFTNFRAICSSVSFPFRRAGFRGETLYQRIRSSCLTLKMLPSVFYEREVLDPHGKLRERERRLVVQVLRRNFT